MSYVYNRRMWLQNRADTCLCSSISRASHIRLRPSIYAPQTSVERCRFFSDVVRLVLSVPNHFVAGDFNVDVERKKPDLSTRCLTSLLAQSNMTDAYRSRNRTVPGFTWTIPNGRHMRRIDLILVSAAVASVIGYVVLLPWSWSTASALSAYVFPRRLDDKAAGK